MRAFRDLDRGRVRLVEAGTDGGLFVVGSPIDRAPMTVIASVGLGWDHVSVSRKNRVPNWAEMEHVKRLFFEDHETAMQLHVPPQEHINLHPYVLHLWRPQNEAIPRPPGALVGAGSRPARDLADAQAIVRDAGIAP